MSFLTKIKKKKKRKFIYNYIVILGILIYLIFKLIANISHSAVHIEIVNYGEINESINKNGIIIRDEKLILSRSTGKINYFIKEGQRIPKNEKIADVEIKKIDSKVKEKLDTLNRRIDGVKENRDVEILRKDIDKIDNNIKLLSLEIKNKVISGNLENIQSLKEDLLYLIDKRSLIWGEKSIVGKNIKTLEEEKSILENKMSGSVNTILSDSTGIVSLNADGLEETLKFSSLDKLDSEYLSDIKNNGNIIEKKEIVQVGDEIAKIVNNHTWYIATILDKDEKDKFKINKSVKIIKDKEVFVGTPIYIYKDKFGKYIGVFEVNEEKEGFYTNRKCNIKIIYKQLNGIKITKDAIITRNGKRGVFVLSETGNATFKELKSILGENNKYVVLNYRDIKKNKINTVDLYDELILNPENIKEGQKVR